MPRGHLANGKLPALCVSLQPVIKQLAWFSNMSVIKYLFYSSYFILMKRSGDCSVGQVKAQVSFPFLPHPNCCHRVPPPLLLLHPKYTQPPDTTSSFFPPSQLCAKTEISGGDMGQGWIHCHNITRQSLADFSPFPRAAGPSLGAGLTLSASRIRPS